MSASGSTGDRIVALIDRIRFGKPVSVEILAESTEGLSPLLVRRVRQVLEQHKDEAGLVVAGQFRVFTSPDAISPALRVRVGRRTEKKHVSWRLKESTRVSVSWRSTRTRIRRRPSGLPPRPEWIGLRPDTDYGVEVQFRSSSGFQVKVHEVRLRFAEKRFIIMKEEDGVSLETWYEVRNI